MIELLGLVVLLSLVTYRVARFIAMDSLWEVWRDKMIGWFEPKGLVGAKLADLIDCPFCITVWIAGGVTVATHLTVDGFAMPVWVWLATAALSLVWWAIVDSE